MTQSPAKKAYNAAYRKENYRKVNFNGLRPHSGKRDFQPFVDPERLREASDAYARRGVVETLLGEPAPGRSALDRRVACASVDQSVE